MIQFKRGRPPKFWTEAREQKLRDLNARGATDGEIARVFGVSRNTITGKRSRMGLSAINAKVVTTLAQRRAMRNERERRRRALLRLLKPKAMKAPPPVEPEPIGPINDIATGCKWINEDPRESNWRMCGQPRSDGSSYCAFHNTLVFAPTKRAEGEIAISVTTAKYLFPGPVPEDARGVAAATCYICKGIGYVGGDE